jgi:hypothetical protein
MWTWSSLISLGCLVGLLGPGPLLAQTCTDNCRSGQIQFTPGDRISVELVNLSPVTVGVEQVPLRGPLTLAPGTSTVLGFGWGTTPNLSMFIWPLSRPAHSLYPGAHGRHHPDRRNCHRPQRTQRSVYLRRERRAGDGEVRASSFRRVTPHF